MAIWYIYIFYGYLFFLLVIWNIFPGFGMLYREKSGDPNHRHMERSNSNVFSEMCYSM
jgi:hypothetical protein